MHTKFPPTVMVFGVISSEGDVMPPYFFEEGHRVNADAYTHVLETVVKPWMDQVASGREYIFQQDSSTQSRENPGLANAERTPSLEPWPVDPFDFFEWDVVQRDVNKTFHNTIQSVKDTVHAVMTHMDKSIVAKACASFRTRLEAIVANKCHYNAVSLLIIQFECMFDNF